MNKKIPTPLAILIILLVIAVIIGVALWICPEKKTVLPQDETADWQTYRNEEQKYEVKYPEEWTAKEWAVAIKSSGPVGANDWLLSEIGFGDNKIVGDYQISIGVSSDSFEEENAVEKNYYPVGEKIIISGQEGIKYVGDSEEVEPVIKIIKILVPYNDKTLILVYTEAPDETDKSEIFNQILSTFSISE